MARIVQELLDVRGNEEEIEGQEAGVEKCDKGKISMEELQEVTNKLNYRKAPGSDKYLGRWSNIWKGRWLKSN